MVNYRVKLFGGWLWLWCNICEINKWLAPALSEHVWAVWKHNGSHLVPAAGQREGRKCSHHSKRGTKISTKGECESNLSCVKKVFFKYSNDLHLATSFCNSSDCKSWWLQPDTCFFSQIFGASLSFRLICFVSADHRAAYLPVGRAGQRSGQRSRQAAAAVDSRAQRSTELLKTADAGEPSWLADAPVLCRAVKRRQRKEGGREGEEIRADGEHRLLKWNAVNQTHPGKKQFPAGGKTLHEYLQCAISLGGETLGKNHGKADNCWCFKSIQTCAKQTHTHYRRTKYDSDIKHPILCAWPGQVCTHSSSNDFFVVGNLFQGFDPYLKLELLNHLHLNSALRCTPVIQSVFTAHVPGTQHNTTCEYD